MMVPLCSYHDLPLYWIATGFIVIGMFMLTSWLVRAWIINVRRGYRRAQRRRRARNGARWVKVR